MRQHVIDGRRGRGRRLGAAVCATAGTRGEQLCHGLHARIERRLTELAFQRAQLIGDRRARIVEHAAAAAAGALTPAARRLALGGAAIDGHLVHRRAIHGGLRHLLEVGLKFGDLGAQAVQALKRRFKERASRAERGRQRGKLGLLRGQLAVQLRARLIGRGRF